MEIPIENTDYYFIKPLYHFGQKLRTPDYVGIVNGMKYIPGDYEHWEYWVMQVTPEGVGEGSVYPELELQPG